MATIPAAGYISNNARSQAQVQTALEDIVASLRQMPGSAQPELYHIIASGVLTPAGSGGVILVDTEGLAATDDLTNVATTNYPDGSMIVLRNANLGRIVTLKHLAGGAGQLNLDRSADYVLDDELKWVIIARRGADWYEVFRGPNRLVSFTVTNAAALTIQKQDLGKTFLCTGSYTVALTAAAAVGNGFLVTIKNIGSGMLTLDPNGSELINGATTITVSPGTSLTITSDGAAWHIVGSLAPQPATNPIINSTMEVWQRGTSFVSPADATYTADRYRWNFVGVGVVTITRSVVFPSFAQAGVAFNYSLHIDVTTIDASIAAGDYYVLSTVLEGGTFLYFAQRPFTLSFWVRSSKTGTHCVSFRNVGPGAVPDRSYVGTYTINTTDTWEYKSITVLASPTTGTWDYTNGVGLSIGWAWAVGSTFQTTAGAWQTGNFLGTSGQVNCMDNAANVMQITGVRIDLGLYPNPIGAMDNDLELLRCQRYYQKSFNNSVTPAQNAGVNTGEWIFPQPVGASTLFNSIYLPLHTMRAAPTVILYNPSAANAQIRNRSTNTDCTGSTAINISEKGFTLQATTPAATAVANQMGVHWAANADL